MGKRVDLRRPVSSKELHSDKKTLWKVRFLLQAYFMILENTALNFRGLLEWRRAKEGIESKRQSGIDHGVYGAKYIYDLSEKYG